MTTTQRDGSADLMPTVHGAAAGAERSRNWRWAVWAVWAVSATFLAISARAALAQNACPANAHVTRVEKVGNVVTMHCACNPGYKAVGGQCQRPAGLDRAIAPKLNPTRDPDVQAGLNRQAERLERQQEAKRQAQIAACVKKHEAHMSAAQWIENDERIRRSCAGHVAVVAGVRG